MHSRIYEVSKEPIVKTFSVDELDPNHWFLREIAASVSCLSQDRQDDSIRFLDDVPGLTVNGNELIIADKKSYFGETFCRYQELLNRMMGRNLEQYSEAGAAFDALQLIRVVRDDHSLYVFDTEDGFDGVMPISDFLRLHSDGEVFHFGTVLDYRY